MKNEMMIFTNEQFGQVRGIEINEKPYVCANDVAKALGYLRPADAVTSKCKGSVKHRVLTNGGEQEMKFIPEADVYRLIFGSKLPQAQEFQDWVCEEVLPSIRKHGAYMTEQTLEQALTSPDFLIQLANQLKQEQEARKLAEQQKDELNKEVNTLLVAEDTISFRDFSQIVDIGRTRLFEILRDMEILDKNNIPYQRYSKYFEVINAVKGDKVYPTTRIKPVGQDYLYKRLTLDGYIK